MTENKLSEISSLILNEKNKLKLKDVVSWKLILVLLITLLIFISCIIYKFFTKSENLKTILSFVVVLCYFLDFIFLLILTFTSSVSYFKTKKSFSDNLCEQFTENKKMQENLFSMCDEFEKNNSGEIKRYIDFLKAESESIEKYCNFNFGGIDVGGTAFLFMCILNAIRDFSKVVDENSIISMFLYCIPIIVVCGNYILRYRIQRINRIVCYLEKCLSAREDK